MRAALALLTTLAACGGNDAKPMDAGPDAPSGPPVIAAVPASIDFGMVYAGDPTSPFRMISIQNSGGDKTGVLGAQLSFTDSSLFRIVSNGCSGGVIAPLGDCDIGVQFRPDTPTGAKEARLLVYATPGGEVVVPLTGIAIFDDRPRLSTTNPNASFGDQAIGSQSPGFTFVISNTGATATGTISAQLVGANPAEFGVNTSCSSPLAPASSCNVSVTFHPSTSGMFAAQVMLQANPGMSLLLDVSGRGVDVALSRSPAMKNYGNVGVGITSTPTIFTISNTGSVASSAAQLQLVGNDPNEFSFGSSNCPNNSIPAGGSCTVAVRFSPQSTGPKSASLSVVASGATVIAPLLGVGVTSGGGFLVPNPSSVTFSDQTVGTPSAAKTITVGNAGTTTSGMVSVSVQGAGAASYGTTTTCTTIPDGSSCNVDVTFTPTATGAQPANVIISAVGASAVSVAVDGNGI